MCFFCRPTCDNCRPKYIYCSECGRRNFLTLSACVDCGHEFSDEERAQAAADWEKNRKGKGESKTNIVRNKRSKVHKPSRSTLDGKPKLPGMPG